ncbi:MAG: sulfotransferase family protein [Actinomycetota bacterium]
MVEVIGVGFGRTGTLSLKLALERVLGGPCYHMAEVISRSEQAVWSAALQGDRVDWLSVFDGWTATVDWPATAFHQEIADAFPDAVLLLSSRDPLSWWASADRTIFSTLRDRRDDDSEKRFLNDLFARNGVDPNDREGSIDAFVRHNEHIRASYSDRLIDWTVGDGWQPLCNKLGVALPAEPFPHANSTAQFPDTVANASRGVVPRNAPPPPLVDNDDRTSTRPPGH